MDINADCFQALRTCSSARPDCEMRKALRLLRFLLHFLVKMTSFFCGNLPNNSFIVISITTTTFVIIECALLNARYVIGYAPATTIFILSIQTPYIFAGKILTCVIKRQSNDLLGKSTRVWPFARRMVFAKSTQLPNRLKRLSPADMRPSSIPR